MKIALCSDLHLEFADIILKNDENADVLILSGDICTAVDLPYADSSRGQRFRDFFKRCAFQFPHTIYVMGNHEHYNGDFQKSAQFIKDELAQYANVHFLDKGVKEIDETVFIGGTLWTDMNQEDPLTMQAIAGMMNDFRIVDNGKKVVQFRDSDGNTHERVGRLMPEDVVVEHKQMLEYIRNVVDGKFDQKFVIVGHHAPCKMSTKPRYQDHKVMNGGYSSNLVDFMLDRPQIKVWTHGHTHDPFDYMIGSIRIVCNPRGYDGHEDRADQFKLQYIEV